MPGQTLTRPSARWGLLLLPYEASTSYLKGAGEGPAALLPHLPRELLESREEVVQGALSPEAYLEAAARAARRILDSGRLVAAVGGEHTVTYGVLDGYVASGLRPAVIQLDAHADLREEYEGSPWSHACVMRRVAEGLALATLGVAVRALSLEEADFLKESGRTVVYAHQLIEGPETARNAAARLGQEVYLTVDIDFLDPSVAPGTGTPEPGGPSWYGGLELIDALLEGKRLVGFDLVEVAPAARRDVTAPAAAALFRYLLAKSGTRL